MKTVRPTLSATADPLLNYQLFSAPAPIQVSSLGKAQNVLLNNSVNNGGKTIYCNKIVVGIPKGTDSLSLTNHKPTATLNTDNWDFASPQILLGSQFGLSSNQEYFVFTFQTVSPADNNIDYELVLSIDAIVNTEMGAFSYELFEFSGTTSDPSTFTKKQTSISMTKTEQQFYLKNFAATSTSAPTVPSTQFLNGDDIRFSWESSGNYFRLFAKGSPTPIYAGTESVFTLAGGISVNSSFFIVATASGAIGVTQPIELFDALTITILNPDLTPNSAKIAGNTSVGGTLNVTGASTLANTTVNGEIHAKTGNVDGDLFCGGQLTGQSRIGGGAGQIKGYDTSGQPCEFAFKYDRANNGNTSGAIQTWNASTLMFKTFIIDHPSDEDKYLVLATLEGPEGAVYYRGSARLKNGMALIELPSWFEGLTHIGGHTVLLTNVDGGDILWVESQNGQKIHEGQLRERSANPLSNQKFDWEAKAVRKDSVRLIPEPQRNDIKVHRFGPYTYGFPRTRVKKNEQPMLSFEPSH